MTEFDEKLKQAINQGQRASTAKRQSEKQAKLSQDELRRQHNDFRLEISDRIEACMRSLINQLPGFEYETLYGDKGWGGAVSRDQVELNRGRRSNSFSRLEITVRPLSEISVVNIVAKGTVRNREIFSRHFHQDIEDAQLDEFLDMVDRWVLEYAQVYSQQ